MLQFEELKKGRMKRGVKYFLFHLQKEILC